MNWHGGFKPGWSYLPFLVLMIWKKEKIFLGKTAFFFSQLLSPPALNNHFTYLLYLLKPLGICSCDPMVPLNLLYHASGLCYSLKYFFMQFSPFSQKNISWDLKYWQKITKWFLNFYFSNTMGNYKNSFALQNISFYSFPW